MPLMKLACTALERVPLTRPKVIEQLLKKFNQDLVFCRAPEDNDLTSNVHGMFFIMCLFTLVLNHVRPVLQLLDKHKRTFNCVDDSIASIFCLKLSCYC